MELKVKIGGFRTKRTEELECPDCGADVVQVRESDGTETTTLFWSHPDPTVKVEHKCDEEPPCWCGARNPHFAELGDLCGGSGVLYCDCGGDSLCVCHNHGEVQCFGCEDCEPDDDGDGW